MGWGLEVSFCAETGEGETPAPRGDSHHGHGPLHGVCSSFGPFCLLHSRNSYRTSRRPNSLEAILSVNLITINPAATSCTKKEYRPHRRQKTGGPLEERSSFRTPFLAERRNSKTLRVFSSSFPSHLRCSCSRPAPDGAPAPFRWNVAPFGRSRSGSRLQQTRSIKFSRIFSPTAPLFSGWNWTP